MTYCYVLSENESSNISVALNCADCPEALIILNHAIIHESMAARYENFDSRPTLGNYSAQAHATLSRKAAEIAREYWQARKA